MHFMHLYTVSPSGPASPDFSSNSIGSTGFSKIPNLLCHSSASAVSFLEVQPPRRDAAPQVSVPTMPASSKLREIEEEARARREDGRGRVGRLRRALRPRMGELGREGAGIVAAAAWCTL